MEENSELNNNMNKIGDSLKIFVEVTPIVIALIGILAFFLSNSTDLNSKININLLKATVIPITSIIATCIVISVGSLSFAKILEAPSQKFLALYTCLIAVAIEFFLGIFFIGIFLNYISENYGLIFSLIGEIIGMAYFILVLNKLTVTNKSKSFILAVILIILLILLSLFLVLNSIQTNIPEAVANALNLTTMPPVNTVT